MAKRRISKASKRRLTVFGTISLIAIIYFGFSLLYNIYNIYELTHQKKELETLYVQLQEDAENIKTYIDKLSDSKYLADYAREHYLYSKDGEYILQLDEDDIKEDVKNISDEINTNYIIVGLSVFMIIIFIYICSKGKKTKKKR